MAREWNEKASGTNATATATHAASTVRRHRIKGASASYSAALSTPKLVQVKDGTTVVLEDYVTERWELPGTIVGSPGNAVSIVLAASGTAGVVGKVNMNGETTV